MIRIKRIVHSKSHCTDLWAQDCGPISPIWSFSLLLPPVVHSTRHGFANSGLPTVYTSLVVLIQVSITVLDGFTSTIFTQHYAILRLRSCDCPFSASFNYTVTMLLSFGATNPHSCYAWLQAFLLWGRWELHSSGPLCSE